MRIKNIGFSDQDVIKLVRASDKVQAVRPLLVGLNA